MRSLLGLIAVAALCANSARAQTVADRADARCMLVLGVAAAQDAKQRERAVQGQFFYLGRLASHGVSARLGPIMIAEAKQITSGQQVQAELTRCGAELNTRFKELRDGLQAVEQASKAAAAAQKGRPPAK